MKTGTLTAWVIAWVGTACLILGCREPAEIDSTGTNEPAPAAEATSPTATDESAAAQPGPAGEETSPAEVSAGATLTPETVQLTLVDKAAYDAAIAAHRGQVVLVDFWATWCIPCQRKFPETVEWSKKFGPDGLAVVSMSMDEADTETQLRVREFLAKHNAVFTNLLSSLGGDEEGMTAFDIDGGALPHYKLYDRDGTLLQKFGEGDPDKPLKSSDIEEAIRKALAGP